MSDYLDRANPNRPDAIGFWHDSRAQKSKYLDALQRVIAALRARATPVNQDDVRGKRRKRVKPHDASNTIKTYLKAIELFSFWMQGTFGYELDPKNVTRKVCFDFLQWMLSTEPPNTHEIKMIAAGGDVTTVFKALKRAVAVSKDGEVNIQQIYEQLPQSAAAVYDPQIDGFRSLHRLLGLTVRDYRSIIRLPTIAKIRAERKVIGSAMERDPLTYRYAIKRRTAYKASSASTYISAMSTIWEAMTEGENILGGEAALQYNPWRGPRGPFAIARGKAREDKRRRSQRVIPNPIIDAILDATLGTDFESRRNRAAIILLIYTGVRAEEITGALRKDLVLVDEVLTLQVFGKGDKYRTIPIYAEVRDALAQMDAKIEEMSQQQSDDPDIQWKAAYAKTLLQDRNAPIIPAMPRWGVNARNIDPQQAALEPLDTSGLRAILSKLVDRTRVYDRTLRKIRPLSDQEKAMVHPHAFRHYAATAAQEAGLPMEEVKRMLGHEDLRTTEGYIHIPPRAMAQVGAYIAQARAGAVMSPEEAERLRRKKRSSLEDENLAPAPAYEPKRKRAATVEVPRAEEQAEEALPVEPKRDLTVPIKSPDWAYQPHAEKRAVYMPDVDDQGRPLNPGNLPKGQGWRLTFRIGEVSRLPWYAGRANTWGKSWSDPQMAPIISYFQAFETDITNAEYFVRDDLEAMFNVLMKERGATSAMAFAKWVEEILGYASAWYFDTMYDRDDEWIDYDQAARPTDKVVRMHPKEKILEWFQAYATTAEAPVLRAPPEWTSWKGDIDVLDVTRIQVEPPVYESVLRLRKNIQFEEFMQLKKPKEGPAFDVNEFVAGTGKDRVRVRFRAGKGPWLHAQLVRKDEDPLQPGTARVYLAGDPIPDGVSKLQISSDINPTEKQKRERGNMYPVIADMKNLPIWFFNSDPIGELETEEKKEIINWLDKLTGKQLSRVRVQSKAIGLFLTIEQWNELAAELYSRKGRGFVQATGAKLTQERRDELKGRMEDLENAFRKQAEQLFGIEINIEDVEGKRGEQRVNELAKSRPTVELYKLEEAQDEDSKEVKQLKKWVKMLKPVERRIFQYVALMKGPVPLDKWGMEETFLDPTGLFADVKLQWMYRCSKSRKTTLTMRNMVDKPTPYGGVWEPVTIVHDDQTKKNFFRNYGTDSECVVRRTIRMLWERKLQKDFEYKQAGGTGERRTHRDIIHRHVSALMAYLVPAPAKMEELLKQWYEGVGVPEPIIPDPRRQMAKALSPDFLNEMGPEDLKGSWDAVAETKAGEDAMSRAIGILEAFGEFGSGQEPEGGGFAIPNAAKGLRVMPNLVRLVFAQFWPI